MTRLLQSALVGLILTASAWAADVRTPTQEGIVYGVADGQQLTMDYYAPKGAGPHPIAIIIPCHRILAKGNKIGGFSAHGGTLTKERLLSLEGVDLQGDTPLLPGLLRDSLSAVADTTWHRSAAECERG